MCSIITGGTIIIRDRKTKKRESSPSNHSELHSDMTPLLESEPQHPSQTSDDSSERNFAHRLALAKRKLVELSKASASRTKKIFLQYGERNLLLATFIITAISYVSTVAIEVMWSYIWRSLIKMQSILNNQKFPNSQILPCPISNSSRKKN